MGLTVIKYKEVQHTIEELKALYNSRVTKDQFLQIKNPLKSSRYNDVKNDINDYADSLRRLNRKIKLLYYLLEDAKNGFENADRYKGVAAKVKSNKYGKTVKTITKKLKKKGYSNYQIAIILRMAGKTGAKKAKMKVNYIVYSSVIPKVSYEALVKENSDQKSAIAEKDKDNAEKDATIKKQSEELTKEKSQSAAKDETIRQKDSRIQELESQAQENNSAEQVSSDDSAGDTGGGETSAEAETSTADTEPSEGIRSETSTESAAGTTTSTGDDETITPDEPKEDDDSITIGGDESDTPTKSKSGGSVIPAVLGVGAAGAAGFAGVRYIKNKNKNNYITEEYDEENSEDVDYSYSDDENGEENYSEEKYNANNGDNSNLSVDGDSVKVSDDTISIENDSNNLSLDEEEDIKIDDDYQDDFDEELE